LKCQESPLVYDGEYVNNHTSHASTHLILFTGISSITSGEATFASDKSLKILANALDRTSPGSIEITSGISLQPLLSPTSGASQRTSGVSSQGVAFEVTFTSASASASGQVASRLVPNDRSRIPQQMSTKLDIFPLIAEA
jgi:hypothetical protein